MHANATQAISDGDADSEMKNNMISAWKLGTLKIKSR